MSEASPSVRAPSTTAPPAVRPPRRVVLISVAAAIGGFLFGFDTAIINGAVDAITTRFALSTAMLGVVVAVTLSGAAGGAAAAGWIADRLGRRRAMLIAAVIFCISSVGCALSSSAVELVGWRLVTGVAVGMASVIAPLYISEIAPASTRGVLSSLQQMAIVLGIFTALLWSAMIADLLHGADAAVLLGLPAWRWMFLSGIIPALLYGLLALVIPESPRHLVAIGRLDDAAQTIRRLFAGTPAAAAEQVSRIAATLTADAKPRFRDVLSRRTGLLPLVWVGVAIAACQNLVGIDVIFFYSTSLWNSVGFGESAAFSLSVASSVVNVIATVVAILLIDRVGRRRLLMVGSAGMAVSLSVAALGFAHAVVDEDAQLVLPSPWGVITLIAANMFVVFFAASWGPAVWVLLGEMFPNRIRAAALSVSAAANWGADIIVNLTFPTLRAYSLPLSYGLYAFFAVVSGVIVWLGVRETAGRELEDMTTDLALTPLGTESNR